MASYSSWNERTLHTDHFLLIEVLKEKFGFKGILILDWEALERLYSPHGSNYRESILLTVNAGIDMVMVPFRYKLFLDELLSLVESGEIPMTRVVLVESGRPMFIEPSNLEKVEALVAAWLTGSEGHGIIYVLFGDHGFYGKLPMTWFKSADQLPMHIESNSLDPLFPFGYGSNPSLFS